MTQKDEPVPIEALAAQMRKLASKSQRHVQGPKRSIHTELDLMNAWLARGGGWEWLQLWEQARRAFAHTPGLGTGPWIDAYPDAFPDRDKHRFSFER